MKRWPRVQKYIGGQQVAVALCLLFALYLLFWGKEHDDVFGEERLLNPSFDLGTLHWKQFHWPRSVSILEDSAGGRSLVITPFEGDKGTVTGVHQFVGFPYRDPDPALRFVQTLAIRSQPHSGDPAHFQATFRVALHSKAQDGTYFFLERVMHHPPHNTTWPLEECVRVVSSKPLVFSMVYLLLESESDQVEVHDVSLTYEQEPPQPDKRALRTPWEQAHPCTELVVDAYERFDTYKTVPFYHSTAPRPRPSNRTTTPAALAAVIGQRGQAPPPALPRPVAQAQNASATIVTQLSISRLDRLVSLAAVWDGPISAAVLLSRDPEDAQTLKSFVAKLRQDSALAIHVLFDDGGPYPVNVLRNLALENALTDWVLFLDIDFLPSPRLSSSLRTLIEQNELRPRYLYVVPAFEVDSDTVPDTKEELVRLVKMDKARPIHVRIAPEAHHATDYENWYGVSTLFETHYENHYEPYFVAHRHILPFDARFKGYGWDKVSHMYELAKAKYRIFVLPADYTVHISHPPLWKDNQRAMLTKVWQNWYDFAFEMELKYPPFGFPFAYVRATRLDLLDWADFAHETDKQYVEQPKSLIWLTWKNLFVVFVLCYFCQPTRRCGTLLLSLLVRPFTPGPAKVKDTSV